MGERGVYTVSFFSSSSVSFALDPGVHLSFFIVIVVIVVVIVIIFLILFLFILVLVFSNNRIILLFLFSPILLLAVR
jgi:hypothetical protein